MASSILSIATSGLAAARAGLATASHNISNANTRGFNRQEIVQSTAFATYTSAGFIGSGTRIETVRRVYSDFSESEVRATASQAAMSRIALEQSRRIDNLLSDPLAGLSPALADFFGGVQDVASSPADTASRQQLLSRANALAARFQSLEGRLTELRSGANRLIAGTVTEVNALAARIAEINQRIAVASGQAGEVQLPNDLLDQRDTMVRELSVLVSASVVRQDDGAFNVFLGNGQAVVVGSQRYTLVAQADQERPEDLVVGVQSGSALAQFRGGDLGGSLGGLFSFRDGTLDQAHNALGRIALGLARAVNEQHQLGQDRYGAPGGAFFREAVAGTMARTTNAGNAVLATTIITPGQLAVSGYRLGHDGAQWHLTRLSDNLVRSYASLPQTVDGLSIAAVSGVPAAGDSWRIEPLRAGARDFAALVSDAGRIAAAAPIRTATGRDNTGSGVVSAGSVNAPPPVNPNLLQPVTITFTGSGTFDVSGTGTGNPAAVTYTPGASISYNGWTIEISGAPAAGDVFTVGPNTAGVADNRNAGRLAALQTAQLLDGGATTLDSAYGQLVGMAGNRTRELQVIHEAHERMAAEAVDAQQSLSGVNLDEEAANLIRYQAAYKAAAQVVAATNEMLSLIMSVTR